MQNDENNDQVGIPGVPVACDNGLQSVNDNATSSDIHDEQSEIIPKNDDLNADKPKRSKISWI